jgi:hypothetical protein
MCIDLVGAKIVNKAFMLTMMTSVFPGRRMSCSWPRDISPRERTSEQTRKYICARTCRPIISNIIILCIEYLRNPGKHVCQIQLLGYGMIEEKKVRKKFISKE